MRLNLPCCQTMEDIHIFRSPIFNSKRRSNRVRTFHRPSNSKEDPNVASNDAQPTCEEEYDSDELNAKGAFNHSSMSILETSQLTEPAGWYLGREYYVVTKGLAVGIFHDLSVFVVIFSSSPSHNGKIGRTFIVPLTWCPRPNGQPARPGSRPSNSGTSLVRVGLFFCSVSSFGTHLP